MTCESSLMLPISWEDSELPLPEFQTGIIAASRQPDDLVAVSNTPASLIESPESRLKYEQVLRNKSVKKVGKGMLPTSMIPCR